MKVITLTIAVSALNEEMNIKPFLKSVLCQEEMGFKIKKIIVVSDGSTDKTVAMAKSIKDKRIFIKSFPTRKGKPARLNYIYKNLTTDILVQSDADVLWSNKYVLKNIVQVLQSDKDVKLSCGNSQVTPGKTFTQRAVNCSQHAYSRIKKNYPSLTVNGCIMALKREFVESLKIPEDLIGDDIYIYFSCLSKGYKYKYAEKAIVYFETPRTLSDHIKQNIRYVASPSKMGDYFSSELIKKEDYISRMELILALAYEYLKHPLLCSYLIIVNCYCRYMARIKLKQLSSKWTMIKSTKKFSMSI